MAASRNTPRAIRPRGPAGRVSWLALVAATSLGVAYAGTVRTAIRLSSEALKNDGPYRLVVQSYDRLDPKSEIRRSQRPRASVQRAVTAADLARGIRVDLVELADNPQAAPGLVVAWVEPGDANLEFDGRQARPQAGSLYGVARWDDERVEIELNRRA
jgi:hypothetical protein